MFWAFKLSFAVDILAFFGLETVWAIFEKLGEFFFKSSGHPAHFQLSINFISMTGAYLSGALFYLV